MNDLKLQRTAFKDENPVPTWEDHLNVSTFEAMMINLDIQLRVKPLNDPHCELRKQRNRVRMQRVVHPDLIEQLSNNIIQQIDKELLCELQVT